MTAALRRALDRLATGTPVVLWRIAAWPGAGATWQARCGRCAWTAFLGWSGWQIVQHSHPAMALTVAWLLTAGWRAGGAAPATPPAEDDLEDEDDPEPPPEATPEQIRARLLPLIHDLIGDRKAVHLDTLLTALVERRILPAGHRVTTLRRELEQAGIPVRDQVAADRPEGRANRVGVHRDDIAALAAATPPTASRAA